jgi:hypothetical protein
MMIFFLSLVTSAKDYFEIVHKLIEFQPNYSVLDYNELGSLISYVILTIKNFFTEFFTLNWLQNLWSLPVMVPDIASAMISEISVLDGYFHNALTFLETPLSYGKQNYSIYGLEKFSIGLINSFFLFLPTSAAHIIMLRRFVFQGIEAGYIAGFGIIAGNVLWLASIIFGWRFFVIPWLSLDILRYLLGFVILVKYMWDASQDERRTNISTLNFPHKTNLAKLKIFLVTFLLALTEQTSLYPFVTNMSVGAESTILEIFPVDNLAQFLFIHSAYLFGIFAGSLSLLHFTCWLWENPIYKIYIWFISSSSFPFNITKGTKTNYYKYLNFIFLYLTMLCTIASVPYFGLDYTITNPLGFVSDDRILYQINKKTNQPELPEVAFLSTQASDRNTRDSRGRHGRRERWKDRLIKYRGMDTSLYEQSIYDLFTIEDLNYGFDKFWLRRKIKNHHSRFRMVIFQPWLLSLKKQLAKPRFSNGVRVELFRMLYEQFYHPNFHAYLSPQKTQSSSTNVTTKLKKKNTKDPVKISEISVLTKLNKQTQIKAENTPNLTKNKIEKNLIINTSALRKFVRKINTRIKSAQIQQNLTNFKKINNVLRVKQSQYLINPSLKKVPDVTSKINININQLNNQLYNNLGVKEKTILSSVAKKKDRQILRYKTLLKNSNSNNLNLERNVFNNAKIMLHPIKFYLQKEKAFKRKWRFYGSNIFRKFSIENNAPYFRIMMKRLFYYYKPTLRWTNTLKLAKNKQGHKVRRKKSRIPLVYNPLQSSNSFTKTTSNNNLNSANEALGPYPTGSFGKVRNPPKSEEALLSLKKPYPTGSSVGFAGSVSKEGSASSWREGSAAHSSFSNTDMEKLEADVIISNNQNPFLKKTTHNYRVVGKNASRYRYQIYKDVLQHWYYTPFNRLLLKFDIDAFIRRQPNSHFLTKKEEQELHLKRFLLSEHYDSLRWYTSMQHYRSMKTNIGGTKSLASRMYNHQFQGTFKKIRHLFAITPTSFSKEEISNFEKGFSSKTQNNQNILHIKPVLKFDQPLYNEYSNTQQKSLINDSVIHEELFLPSKSEGLEKKDLATEFMPFFLNLGQGLFTQRDQNSEPLTLKEYLKTANEKDHTVGKNLLLNKNYKELTKFLFTSLPRVSKEGSASSDFGGYPSRSSWKKNQNPNSIGVSGIRNSTGTPSPKMNTANRNHIKLEQDLWFSVLKNLKKNLYDQEFLTKFLERRIKKKEKRQQKKEKELKNRLKRLKIWLAFNPKNKNLDIMKNNNFNPDETYLLTTGLKNAIKDGFLNINVYDKAFFLKGKAIGEKPNLLTLSLPSLPEGRASSSTPSSWRASFGPLRSSPTGGREPDIILKLKNKETLQNRFFGAEKLLYTTFLKTKIMTQIISRNLKKILNLSINASKKKLLNGTEKYGEAILTWDIKEKILKKRKLLKRKKYTKEIKKAQTTLASTMRAKEQKKLDQKMSLKENKILSLIIPQYGFGNISKGVRGGIQKTNQSKLALTPIKLESTKFIYPKVNLSLSLKKQSFLKKTGNEQINKNNSLFISDKRLNTDLTSYILSKTFKNQVNTYASPPFPTGAVGIGKGGIEKNLKKRKKKLTENEIINDGISGFKFNKLNLNKKESDFLYFNTLYGQKFELKQKFRRKKTKNRLWQSHGRNQRYGRSSNPWRSHNRVEHPSFNANLERKSANMVPEKRLQILKEQAELNYGLKKNMSEGSEKKKRNFALNLKKRKSKKRNWKKYKKGINNYGFAMRKARKQNTASYTLAEAKAGKIIATQLPGGLTKQIKRVQLRLKLQEWWWKQFLPNLKVGQSLKGTTERNWQLEKERQLQKKISKLSKTEILEQEAYLNSSNLKQELQIGDYDFKPLANLQAFHFQNNVIKSNQKPLEVTNQTNSLVSSNNTTLRNWLGNDSAPLKNQKPLEILEKNLFSPLSETFTTTNQFLLTINPLPFYAGWDESLRKFVVTNRLLSRRESGFSITSSDKQNLEITNNLLTDSQNLLNLNETPNSQFLINKNKIEFTNFPLQGMNAGTTLYCQVPFTTFDPDQLFSKGMDGFAPIGWRRFDFTHTIFKTQFNESFFESNLTLKDKTSSKNILKPLIIQKNLLTKLQSKTERINFKKPSYKEFDTIKKYTNYSRRLKKHYKRIKKLQNEKVPVFLISGPLINQVLPIHYINVFNKQNRLSRDRYLKRLWLRHGGKKGVPKAIKEFTTKNAFNIKINAYNNRSDFTLRRRLKTRRKYHRKSSMTKGNTIRPRRHKFFTQQRFNLTKDNTPSQQINQTNLRKRPSKRKLKKNQAKLIRDYDGGLTTKARQRQKIKKTGALNARLRQLRRRVSRQVLKTVPRRRPRAGGFIWPGDYLRLEQTESPKLILNKVALAGMDLKNQNISNSKAPLGSKDSNKQKIPRKLEKKSILLDLYVQPRKDLLEKHNLKVLKKKLEKA